MQVWARPLVPSLVVLLVQAVSLGAVAEECVGEACRSEGFGADEAYEQSLVQLNLVKHDAKNPNKARLESTSSAAVIESMVQQGHITANMARGLSNASLLLEAARRAGLSSWTLADAEDHIAATVKELRSERLSRAGPLLARVPTSAIAKAMQDPMMTEDDVAQIGETIPAVFALVAGVTSGTPSPELITPALQVATVGMAFAVKGGLVAAGGPATIGFAITALFLKGFVDFMEDKPAVEPEKEMYELVMADMHIAMNRALMRDYLQELALDATTLSEELGWAPVVMNKSSSDYSSSASLTYELMLHHDCAGISHRIRTAWRTGTDTEKRDWAKAVMPLAEIVAATQASLLMSMASRSSTMSSAITDRLKSVFADQDSSWAPMFREWLEDIRAVNLEDRKAKLGDWSYTECDGSLPWSDSKTIFLGTCQLEADVDVCYSTGCLGGHEAEFSSKDVCEAWQSQRQRKDWGNPRSLPCRREERDMWLESVYDISMPNQWNHGMEAEESHYNALSGLLTMQTEGQVKLLYQVLADRPVVAAKRGERLPQGEPLLGQCQGDCDNDSECEEHLVCRQRVGNSSLAAQCVGNIRGDSELDGVDFCIVPELRHLGWHNVDANAIPYGSKSRGAVMQFCEGHCKSNADCQAGLICYQSPAGEQRVPGCWGVPVPKMSYCIRPTAFAL